MIRSLFSAIMLAAAIICQASTIDQQADSAYAEDDYAQAAALYTEMINQEGTSAQLLYNLGNCYYRLGKPGLAIINYERALRIDPTFANARANLDFVNSQIVDRQGERGSFLSNSYDKAALAMTANGWAWIAFILFLAAAAGCACYLFGENVLLRKTGFFGGIVLMLAFIAALVISFRARAIADDKDTAIITAVSTILSTSPREPKDRNEEAMMLHEGTKVTILDSISSKSDSTQIKWYDVQIDNAHRAWIKSTVVERI